MLIFKHPRINCFNPLGDLIQAGGSVIGGLLGNRSQKSANEQMLTNQREADHMALQRQLEAQRFSSDQAYIAWERQQMQSRDDIALQREFAQHGVGWKIQDARNQGIDPLAALGSSTFYSPVGKPVGAASSSAASGGSGAPAGAADYSWLGALGQNLGRAAMKMLTKEEIQHTLRLKKLNEQGLLLDNQNKILRNKQIEKELENYGTQVQVPFPSAHSQEIPGQNDAVKVVPNEVIRHHEGHTAGVHAMYQYRLGQTQPDGSIPIYSAIEQEAGDAMDADFPTKMRFNMRAAGRVLKSWFKGNKDVKPSITKKGYHLRWNRLAAQWMFVPNSVPLNIKQRSGDPRDRGTQRKRFKIVR